MRGTDRGDGGTVRISGRPTVRGAGRPLSRTARLTGVGADALIPEAGFDVDRDRSGTGRNQLGMMRGPTTVTAALRFTRAAASDPAPPAARPGWTASAGSR
ncbi:hypothetical protein GCM10010206_30910 [Streptomyces cinerochromogenes]|nr:hypothetical protein GCM10010206_30910 [Streptomyces cinerochromogenes]